MRSRLSKSYLHLSRQIDAIRGVEPKPSDIDSVCVMLDRFKSEVLMANDRFYGLLLLNMVFHEPLSSKFSYGHIPTTIIRQVGPFVLESYRGRKVSLVEFQTLSEVVDKVHQAGFFDESPSSYIKTLKYPKYFLDL